MDIALKKIARNREIGFSKRYNDKIRDKNWISYKHRGISSIAERLGRLPTNPKVSGSNPLDLFIIVPLRLFRFFIIPQ